MTTAFLPKIIENGGGSVVLTSSAMGIKAQPSSAAYAAKHGVLGLMKTIAWEAGEDNVRCNAVLPGMVDTTMLQGGTIEQSAEWQPRFFTLDRALLPDGMIPPDGISRAVVFLASDPGRVHHRGRPAGRRGLDDVLSGAKLGNVTHPVADVAEAATF